VRRRRAALLGLAVMSVVIAAARAEAEPVSVRFAEGVTHGFLLLRSPAGDVIADGDLLQVVRPEGVESRLMFRFRDGSLYDETAVFSQQRVFSLLSYKVQQRGPSFPEEMDASLSREGEKGRYQVRSRAERGEERQASGEVDMPADVYSGMLTMIVKNVAKGTTETVHVLAFTPKPILVQVEITPVGEESVLAGERRVSATHFVLKPKLGLLRGTVARIIGKSPADYHCWIVIGNVPAFVGIDGPLYTGGPSWRVETVSPRPPARGSGAR
jgi:hypothetical protein